MKAAHTISSAMIDFYRDIRALGEIELEARIEGETFVVVCLVKAEFSVHYTGRTVK